jgi:hypothetical protein
MNPNQTLSAQIPLPTCGEGPGVGLWYVLAQVRSPSPLAERGLGGEVASVSNASTFAQTPRPVPGKNPPKAVSRPFRPLATALQNVAALIASRHCAKRLGVRQSSGAFNLDRRSPVAIRQLAEHWTLMVERSLDTPKRRPS